MTDNSVVDMVPKLTNREVRTQRRLKHLSDIVTQMASEKGFDAISVNEVAERAKMSVGGLYRYISTKQDLLVLVCDSIHLESLEELKKAAKSVSGITNKLEAAYLCYWDRHWQAHASIAIAYREYKSLPEETKKRYLDHQNKIADFFSDIIRAGVMAEEFCEVDDQLLAHEMIFLAHMRALKGWALLDRTREQVRGEHLQLVLCRLGVGKNQ
jgi:AcrR family transcriptional regulator